MVTDKKTVASILCIWLFYFLLLLFIFYPAIVALPDRMISTGDIHRSHFWYLTYFKDSLAEGRFPFWNPYIYLGQPFLANPSVTPWYPGTWLLLIASLPVGFLVHFLFHIFWSMVGVFVFLLPIGGLFAASVGGLVFGLSGVMIAHVWGGNYDVVAAGSWIGWVMAGVWHLLVRPRKRTLALAALSIGGQFLAGYATMALFTWIAIAILVAIFTLHKRSPLPLFWVVGACLLGMSIAAVQLLPNREFASRTIRSYKGTYDMRSGGAIRPEFFSQLVLPFPFGGEPSGGGILNYRSGETSYWEHAMYVGFAAASFAAVAVLMFVFFPKKVSKSQKISIASILLLCLFSAWVSMGRFAPIDLYHALWERFSLYRLVLRVSARHIYLVDFGLAVLAGIGVGIVEKQTKKAVWLLRLSICAVILGELIPYGRQMIVTDVVPTKKVSQETVSILKRMKPGERFDQYFNLFFHEDASVAYRIPSVSGYDVTLLKGPYEFILAATNQDNGLLTDMAYPFINPGSKLASYLSIRYQLIDYSSVWYTLASDFGGTQVSEQSIYNYWFNAPSTFRIFEHADVLSPWFLVAEMRHYISQDALFGAIRRNEYDYTTAVGIVGDKDIVTRHDCPSESVGTVRVQSFKPEEVVLAVMSHCASFLTGSQPYFPGWEVEINGSKTPIFEGNLGFITFAVPQGTHTVVLRYKPTIFVWSMGVSVIGWALVVYCFVHTHRRGNMRV